MTSYDVRNNRNKILLCRTPLRLFMPSFGSFNDWKQSLLVTSPFYFSTATQPLGSPSDDSDSDPPKRSCRECLVTGVLTCTALSCYFFYLASEIGGKKEMTQQLRRHRNFLYGGSAIWGAIGAYRLYLD